MNNTVEFTGDDFESTYKAVGWLKERGFSVGSMQGDAPRAIWHGDCYISKWRGLSAKEKREMHASMTGDPRSGPVRITLHAAASAEAREAFERQDPPA